MQEPTSPPGEPPSTGEHRPPAHSPEPAVTRERVRDALEAMSNLHVDRPSPLEHLALVDAYLAMPENAGVDRRFALRDILTEAVRRQARRYSHRLDQPPLPEQPGIREAERLVKAAPSIPVYLGWLWLYLRYGCDLLGLTGADFAKWASISDKNRQRYARAAMQQFADHLMAAERDAYRATRQRRLADLLPALPQRLYGQDALIHRLLHALDQHRPRHIQVTGPPGIGKTAVVGVVLHHLIQAGQVDALHWPPEPSKHVIDLRDRLVDAYRHRRQGRRLREYVASTQTAVIIDDADPLYDEQMALRSLLVELHPATVFVVSRQAPLMDVLPVRVRITPLERSAAEAFVHAVAVRHIRAGGWSLTPAEVSAILHDAGGIPRRIEQAVSQYWHSLE